MMAGFDFRSSALELRLVRPAAVPSRVPTQSWPADHARWSHHHDRRWRHHERRRLNHDDPPRSDSNDHPGHDVRPGHNLPRLEH
jgi:hypothetical protein